MSSFLTPLILEVLPNRKFKVAESFNYYTDIQFGINKHFEVTVPVGFVTDLATIPRILWPLLPPHGEYGKAAVLHDFCYETGLNNKKWADNVFKEAMQVLGVPRWKITLMYYTVKVIGRGKFKR